MGILKLGTRKLVWMTIVFVVVASAGIFAGVQVSRAQESAHNTIHACIRDGVGIAKIVNGG